MVGVFLYQNSHWIVVRFPVMRFDLARPFYITEFESPLSAIVVVAFLSGAALILPGWLKRMYERTRSNRRISKLEAELADLRNLPVTDPTPLEDIDHMDRKKTPRSHEDSVGDDDESLLRAALQRADSDPLKGSPK